jgi:predicted SnoaL-like aldol condensation-catalyzing enzyme
MTDQEPQESFQKEQAVSFLEMCANGQAGAAYKIYTAPELIHHNVHFPAEPEALSKGMDDNAVEHPSKTYEVQRVLEDQDTVAVHGRVVFAGLEIAVVHIVRFEDEKIVEMWDVAMPVPDDSPNSNGPF